MKVLSVLHLTVVKLIFLPFGNDQKCKIGVALPLLLGEKHILKMITHTGAFDQIQF